MKSVHLSGAQTLQSNELLEDHFFLNGLAVITVALLLVGPPRGKGESLTSASLVAERLQELLSHDQEVDLWKVQYGQ